MPQRGLIWASAQQVGDLLRDKVIRKGVKLFPRKSLGSEELQKPLPDWLGKEK